MRALNADADLTWSISRDRFNGMSSESHTPARMHRATSHLTALRELSPDADPLGAHSNL